MEVRIEDKGRLKKRYKYENIPFELIEANTHIAFIAANASFLIEKIIEEPAEVNMLHNHTNGIFMC